MSDAGVDLTPQAREQLGRAALDWALRYFAEQAELPVYPTDQRERADGPSLRPAAARSAGASPP